MNRRQALKAIAVLPAVAAQPPDGSVTVRWDKDLTVKAADPHNWQSARFTVVPRRHGMTPLTLSTIYSCHVFNNPEDLPKLSPGLQDCVVAEWFRNGLLDRIAIAYKAVGLHNSPMQR